MECAQKVGASLHVDMISQPVSATTIWRVRMYGATQCGCLLHFVHNEHESFLVSRAATDQLASHDELLAEEFPILRVLLIIQLELHFSFGMYVCVR